MAALCAQPRCVFLGYGGYAEAMEGLPDCIGYGYAEATIVEFSYAEAMLPFCTNSLPGRCALKKNAAEDRVAVCQHKDPSSALAPLRWRH